MKVSFVGLGVMGKYMALNMAKSGDISIVCDVVDKAFPEFEAIGVKTSKNSNDAADADIVFLSLPDTGIVEKVVYGMLPQLKAGTLVVDLSTIKYNATLEIKQKLEEKGVDFLDAPVSGMEARAKDGTLTVMCGGKEELFNKAHPYFERIGTKILFMGGTGCGQLTKLINQLLFDINCAALAEILPMSVKMGLPAEKVAQVVNTGTGRSYASEQFTPGMLARDFHHGYPMKSAYKDLVSAAELGAARGIPMPVLAAATATYQQALLRGWGDLDKGGMVQVFEELLGVKFASEA